MTLYRRARGAAVTFAGNKKGFTLIEVVLTIVIISVGLVAMMFVFDNVTRGSMEADMNVTATFLARERLEIAAFDKVYRGYDYLTGTRYPASENVSVGGRKYVRETVVYEVDKIDLVTTLLNSNFKRVDVTVKWGTASTQRIIETTLFTR
ncbi:MAG: hypothetical protein COV46_02750 [Deltaproteobacteria bacterium CG11_big_fil_rev_8_21_14_0_20_49_13]|nr:MAG: hypothetical protein COV46_02750 [Deltaproteobacteria bacterium CG11_big_fil_rev_8_21_14_0_20_49_13]